MPQLTNLTTLLSTRVCIAFLLVSFSQLSVAKPNETEFLDFLIHKDIASLPAPKPSSAVSLYEYEIEIRSQEAYQATQQGFGHLMGMWDFQAYRFFIEALKADHNSLMATCGAALSLMAGDGHFLPQNQVALGRIAFLLEQDSGTKFEQQMGNMILNLAKGDFQKCGKELQTIIEQEPKGWKFPALLNSLLARDGYTQLGDPKYFQKKTIEVLREYSLENSSDPAPLTFFVTAQVDNPEARENFYNEILPCARKLARLYPDFPYYQFLAGYCEFRCGDPFLAEAYYRSAAELYAAFISENKIASRNCRELINARIGIISSLLLQENYETARKEAKILVSTAHSKQSYLSLAENATRWEGDTFALRAACFEGSFKQMEIEATAIAKKVKSVPSKQRKLYHYFWLSLEAYARLRIAYQEGDQKEIERSISKYTTASAKLMPSVAQETAIAENQIIYWRRANFCLEVLEYEMKTIQKISQNRADSGAILPWINSAIDKQDPARDLMPPLWLKPMEFVKAEYLFSIENYEEALKSYNASYSRMPNHYPTMVGLHKTLVALKRSTDAKKVAHIITSFDARKKQK